MVNEAAYNELMEEISPKGVTLVAVSKLKPVSDIQALYDLGHRDFGENYVQELVDKQAQLPGDIRWHFIGHLQSNKVKYIAPFVHLIHTVDSFKLLLETNRQAAKNNRIIDVLLQQHIAQEETKFGMDDAELVAFLAEYHSQKESLKNARIRGVMGMSSFTENKVQIATEFDKLRQCYQLLNKTEAADTLSMGMSGDYQLAIENGSTMIRVGSALFGLR